MGVPTLRRIPQSPVPPSLTLPGGATLRQSGLVDVIQPALAPLMPVFSILDAVISVFNAVKAIPDSLGPPPDPTKLVDAIAKLTKKVAALLRLVPQLSLPLAVIGVIDLVLEALGQLRDRLVFLQHAAESLASTRARAEELEDAALASVAACAQANIEQEASNLLTRLAGVGALFNILGTFTAMIGGPGLPDVTTLAGQPLGRVVQPLDELVTTLQQVRSAIPLPP